MTIRSARGDTIVIVVHSLVRTRLCRKLILKTLCVRFWAEKKFLYAVFVYEEHAETVRIFVMMYIFDKTNKIFFISINQKQDEKISEVYMALTKSYHILYCSVFIEIKWKAWIFTSSWYIVLANYGVSIK